MQLRICYYVYFLLNYTKFNSYGGGVGAYFKKSCIFAA